MGHDLNVMSRLVRDEILKQRLSEVTGMPSDDILALDSRCLESKSKKPMECTNSLYRELRSIASALQIDTAEEGGWQSSSRATQQQNTYASMLKHGSSLLQAGVSLVKSVVIGIGEEAEANVGNLKPDDLSTTEEEGVELQKAKADVKQLQSAVKYSKDTPDGGDKARKALKEAEDRVEALMMGSTSHKSCQVVKGNITLEEGASPPSSVASQALLIVKTPPTSYCNRNSNSIAQYLTSSIPCYSLSRLSEEETFAKVTSLSVVNLSSVESREARCSKADVGQLMQKVMKLKQGGLSMSTMSGHVDNVHWTNLTGRMKPFQLDAKPQFLCTNSFGELLTLISQAHWSEKLL